MFIRSYLAGDERELWNLFFNTVRNVNARHYTQEQVQAWAPGHVDETRWQRRIEALNPFLCLHNDVIVGYADLQDSGDIDHFYVHHLWQGKGVGKRLFATLESKAEEKQICELSANVSITARPFFESRGFRVVRQQEVNIGTVVFTNFRMIKPVDAAATNTVINHPLEAEADSDEQGRQNQ